MKFNLNRYFRKFKHVFVFEDDQRNWENSFIPVFCGLIMGLWITSFIIWNRLIRERLPREITGEIYSFTYWIVLFAFINCFFQLLYQFNQLRKKFKGLPSTKMLPDIIAFVEARPKLLRIIEFFSVYIVSGPLFLWRFIYLNILPSKTKSDLTGYCYHLGLFLWKKCFFENSNYHLRSVLTIYLLILLPRIIAVSVFLYEIAINHRLEMFYRVSPLLFIPVIFFSLKQILIDLCNYECKRLEMQYLRVYNVIRDKSGNGDVRDCDITIRCDCVNYEEYSWAMDYHSNWREIKDTLRVFERLYKRMFVCRLLMNLMLTLSFFIWLLIMLKIY